MGHLGGSNSTTRKVNVARVCHTPLITMTNIEIMNPRDIQQQITALAEAPTCPGTSMITILCAAGRDLA